MQCSDVNRTHNCTVSLARLGPPPGGASLPPLYSLLNYVIPDRRQLVAATVSVERRSIGLDMNGLLNSSLKPPRFYSEDLSVLNVN